MLAEILALPRRPIAELVSAVVVPPGALIVGRTIENLEMDVGMLEPDPAELHHVLRLEPDRQPPVIERHLAEIADAQTRHLHAVLVGIERADRFTERLADAIAAVGACGHVGADAVIARVEPD